MSRFRRFEIVDPRRPSYFFEQTIFSPPKTLFLDTPSPCFPAFPIPEDVLQFHTSPPFFFDEFDAVAELIQIETAPFRRFGLGELQLQALCDRVSDLELGFERLRREKKKKLEEKKYSWTAEIGTAEKHRKYKLSTEIKGGEDEKKTYKWTAQIKGDGCPVERTYTVEVSSGKPKKNKVKKENAKSEPSDHGAIVLRQAFTKRPQKKKGKTKELSPQDAAALIQMSFRAYLIRRSQALRALRELAIAKNKLKELRGLFNNFSYCRLLSRAPEECQRFSEKIIVLLLTVDAIEGADLMVRSAKKSMVDELEAMLDVVDPQPGGKSSLVRRTFDMPDGVINKELAAGVAKVVEMLDEEDSTAS
ncbi:BAG family molecular chaperone regulator 7-like [Salvia splendens]|uniref:BAG family molecular chaperone regulator 7-like n=1 Tax=Salvia splendens TaxID=180675 RepID=UPI001C27D23D|nr:BAG family molecular chaperone regulator 7-like [Salvia splendens]